MIYLYYFFRGWIEEQIYDITQDPEDLINSLERIPIENIEKLTPQILGNFPNTYTFTKSMSERILKKNKPKNFTLSILRPSIIGSSWRDPFIGWIDTVSAAGALFLLGGLGIVRHLEGIATNIGDQIPVDFVADWIIVSGACYANRNDLHVIHCASSSKHPVTWKTSQECIVKYWKQSPPEKTVGECVFSLIENPKILKVTNLPTYICHLPMLPTYVITYVMIKSFLIKYTN